MITETDESFIYTYTGGLISVLNPDPKDINIYDIAHALSLMPRFGGHTAQFYSVARHSVWVADHLTDHKLEGLMHDATEAYLVDVPRPIKPYLTNYKEIEDNLMSAIYSKFNLQYPLTKDIKEADNLALQWEVDNVLYTERTETSHGEDEVLFLERFFELYNKK